MSVVALHRRIAKLEANRPAPPDALENLFVDEITVMILENCMSLLDHPSISPEQRGEATADFEHHSREIIEHANWRSGRWLKPTWSGTYAESVEYARHKWMNLTGGSADDYVPALTDEHEGMKLPKGPVAPDLMQRRAALWKHPIVCSILADAPNAPLPEGSFYREA